MYQSYKDFHFISFTKADVPIMESGNNETNQPVGSINVQSSILSGDNSEIIMPNTTSSFIISLNGITLAENLDYKISTVSTSGTSLNPIKILELSGETVDGDILTYGLINSGNEKNISFDNYIIETPIISGGTNNQGNNSVYYNTNTGRYELYTKYDIKENNDIILTLNGVTLANNIDYFLSNTNKKRIILMGSLIMGDIINIFYNDGGPKVGDLYNETLNVSWSITPHLLKIMGYLRYKLVATQTL